MDVREGAFEAHLGAVDARGRERSRARRGSEAPVRDEVDSKAQALGVGGEVLEVGPQERLPAGE